jgi:hypothetical protein
MVTTVTSSHLVVIEPNVASPLSPPTTQSASWYRSSARNLARHSTPASHSRFILGADDSAVQITSSAKAAWVISILTGITFVGSMSTGLVTIALPTIARDLKLPSHLLLWYFLRAAPSLLHPITHIFAQASIGLSVRVIQARFRPLLIPLIVGWRVLAALSWLVL